MRDLWGDNNLLFLLLLLLLWRRGDQLFYLHSIIFRLGLRFRSCQRFQFVLQWFISITILRRLQRLCGWLLDCLSFAVARLCITTDWCHKIHWLFRDWCFLLFVDWLFPGRRYRLLFFIKAIAKKLHVRIKDLYFIWSISRFRELVHVDIHIWLASQISIVVEHALVLIGLGQLSIFD